MTRGDNLAPNIVRYALLVVCAFGLVICCVNMLLYTALRDGQPFLAYLPGVLSGLGITGIGMIAMHLLAAIRELAHGLRMLREDIEDLQRIPDEAKSRSSAIPDTRITSE